MITSHTNPTYGMEGHHQVRLDRQKDGRLGNFNFILGRRSK